MLDAQGYKSSEEETREFDALARRIFAEETSGEGSLDTLLGHDQNGNLWIYASEEAKVFAESQSQSREGTPGTATPVESRRERPTLKSIARVVGGSEEGTISRAESEPAIPTVDKSKAEEGYAYAKTLRLTSEQLVSSSKDLPNEKSLNLKRGKNSISFAVNSSFAGKATCNAHMFFWKYNVPIVISDIDGTITKSPSHLQANADPTWWDIFTR